MGFSTQARVNINSAALQGGVIDANATSVWYEKAFPFSFLLDGSSVLTQMTALQALPAANLATAQNNAAANPTLIQDLSAVGNAVQLSAVSGTNKTTWNAGQKNWLLPQLVPQGSGAPSNGYAIQLYNGDPNAGGTLITTTAGTTGTGESKSVGWIYNYALGLLLLSADFFTLTGISSGTFDPYINGFRYVGATATTTASTGGFDYADLLTAAQGQTQFTLSAAPNTSRPKHQIVLNGRIMTLGGGNDYTIAGTTLTFTFGLRPDDVLVAYYVT